MGTYVNGLSVVIHTGETKTYENCEFSVGQSGALRIADSDGNTIEIYGPAGYLRCTPMRGEINRPGYGNPFDDSFYEEGVRKRNEQKRLEQLEKEAATMFPYQFELSRRY